MNSLKFCFPSGMTVQHISLVTLKNKNWVYKTPASLWRPVQGCNLSLSLGAGIGSSSLTTLTRISGRGWMDGLTRTVSKQLQIPMHIDPKQTSKLVLEGIKQANIKLLEWPYQTPDIKSIEIYCGLSLKVKSMTGNQLI